MKISTTGAAIQTNTSSTQFTVASSGKMFKILMAGLYSNHAESITREIWSNAYDAHRMSGQSDRPFEVVFPNSFREEFVCRDFGTGISHEDMQNLYTILGYSSKEETNEGVGKWGVGRMSPMAYTDTFTITSWHKGMKATYNVTLNGRGEPTLQTLVSPTACVDEPSGLRISFPVNRSDLTMFQKAAKRVAVGFEVKPIVLGQPSFDWESPKITHNGNGYSIFTCNHYSSVLRPNQPYAKMGCVLYPIDTNQLGSDEQVRRFLSNNPIIIDFPIGDLEVTASRESLSYGADEPTVENISKVVRKIIREISKDVQDNVNKCKTPWEAFCTYHTALNGLVGATVRAVDGQISYNGNLLDKIFPLPLVESYSEKNGRKTRGSFTGLLSTAVDTSIKILVTYKDGPKHTTRVQDRIKQLVVGVSRAEHLLVTLHWDKDSSAYDTKKLEDLKTLFGGDCVVILNDVAPPASSIRAKNEVSVRDTDNKPTTIDFNEGGLFVPCESCQPAYDHNLLLNGLKAVGAIKDKQVVLVPKTLWGKFKGSSGDWIDLMAYAKDTLLEPKQKKEIVDCIETVWGHRPHHLSKVKGDKLVDLLAIPDHMSSYKGLNTTVWVNILNALGETVSDTGGNIGKAKVIKLVDQAGSDYPLLYRFSYNTDGLQDYINLVDENNRLKALLKNTKVLDSNH